MPKTIFISYRANLEGNIYKNLLVGWSENHGGYFDIKFNDSSVGVSIRSSDAQYIKRVIRNRIKESQAVIFLITEKFHESDWCKWEIDVAKELNKKLVAIKIKKSYITPENLKNSGVSWAHSFTYDAIKKAVDD